MLIVITGVTHGLGRALAEWFIAANHTVVGCGRSGSEVFDLRFTHPEPHAFDALDITESVRVEIWSEKIQGTHGLPDILINNAAIMPEPMPLWKLPAQDFGKAIDTNVKGPANIIRAFVPGMVARGTGLIVNLSSAAGRIASPKLAAYSASKFAVEGLTQALAGELPVGMAAVTLNPGIINTAMIHKYWPEAADNFPDAKSWAEQAGPFILGLGAEDNGKSLSVPGAEDSEPELGVRI